MDFKNKYSKFTDLINNYLEKSIVEKDTPEKAIYTAMRYSILAGGKRLRPVLSLAVCEMLDGDVDEVIPYACAIEMIHTYSLIHDDLPAMDNDDYRRGRLTNHKVFGEAMAILAGDSLLNSAYELMLRSTLENQTNVMAKVRAMNYIAASAGALGMIGGQVVDLEWEGKDASLEVLSYMHKGKTSALIKAPIMAAAFLSNANQDDLNSLESFAEKIGLAFQIKDDILDVEGNSDVMGKKTGSDAANKKSTFASIYGIDEAKEILKNTIEQAVEHIEKYGQKGHFLRCLADYIVKREN